MTCRHIDVPISDIQELDEGFWYNLGYARPSCRNILEHAVLINNANLDYPIILCYEGRMMDGMHRVCKAEMQGQATIKAKRFKVYIQSDNIGLGPDKLPYDTVAAKLKC